jgi:hypothetical protein
LSADEVVALWRIGDKYMIPHLREEALNRIRNTYPSVLDDWDTINVDWDKPIPNGIDGNALFDLSDLWSLAQVSHQGHLFSALPAIYLEMVRWATRTILNEHYSCNHLTMNMPKTFLEDILSGKEFLARVHRRTVFSWLGKGYGLPAGCEKPHACRLARLAAAQDLSMCDADIHTFGDAMSQSRLMRDFCGMCKSDAKRAYSEGSLKYWNCVPKAFGLGTWTELNERTEKESGLVMDVDP